MLKYSNNSIKESANDHLLGNNLLSDNLLDNNNPVYINSNIYMNTKTKSNLDQDMTNYNFLEKNFRINIKNLFQQFRDQTTCKKLTKNVLEQTYSFLQYLINKILLSDLVPIYGLHNNLQPF